jgi:hypothetical protein
MMVRLFIVKTTSVFFFFLIDSPHNYSNDSHKATLNNKEDGSLIKENER